jgi:hypothetical protein
MRRFARSDSRRGIRKAGRERLHCCARSLADERGSLTRRRKTVSRVLCRTGVFWYVTGDRPTQIVGLLGIVTALGRRAMGGGTWGGPAGRIWKREGVG